MTTEFETDDTAVQSADSRQTGALETGTVKWFSDNKGYGFIAQDAGGADLFAHYRDIIGTGFKTLIENQRVEFEVKQSAKGLQATQIRVLS